MSDKSLQDVVSGSGRSIRRIPVSRRPKPKRVSGSSSVVGRGSGLGGGNSFGRKKSRFGIWFVAIISIIILFLAFNAFSSGVKIKITPRNQIVSISGSFTAFKEPQSGELKFNLMTVTRELSEEVPATSEEFVEEKASGRIVVYNNYSSATQKLIKNTRFEAANGLIFRIKDAITVPGQRTSGGEKIPGSVEVTVYADEPGDEYNIGLSDFTIPGLKGDPRFSEFYARSKTEMAGGARGNVKKASAEDLASVSASLGEKLNNEILEEANSVKPEGFTLLDGAYVIKTDTKTSNGSEGNVLITQVATLSGVIFEDLELAEFLAENTVASYDNLPVRLNNHDDLTVTLSVEGAQSIDGSESISFDMSGEAEIVWVFDENALKNDLAGVSKDSVNSILSRYPAVQTAEVILKPFWKRSVSDNPEDIELEITI